MENNEERHSIKSFERKLSTDSDVSRKSKFHSFRTKNSSTIKEDDQLNASLNRYKASGGNRKATYLNSLLKKSFQNTINKTRGDTSLNISVANQKLISRNNNVIQEENLDNEKLNSNLYPEKRPINFLPPYLFDNINVNRIKKITRQTKNELRDVLDLYDKQRTNMKANENEIEKIKKDLKEAKDARTKISEELFNIKKEIERLNEISLNNSQINPKNNNDIFSRLNTCNAKNEEESENIDKEIEDYENKISQLKFNNKSFYEDYDMLCNDYKKNLMKNKALKNGITEVEKKINDALKEKANLKKYIEKMGKF